MSLTPEQQMCNERHERIDARLKEAEEAIKENTSLVTAIKELAIETKYMREDMNKVIDRLTKLESRDSEKWDKFKWAIIAAIISSVVGILLGAMYVLLTK